jgi:hypothetical protein
VVDQAGADVDYVPAALADHLSDGVLGDVKKAGQVHGRSLGVVGGSVFGEGLADIDAGVIDEGVDPTEPCQSLFDDLLGGLGLGDVARHGDVVRLAGRGDRQGGADDEYPHWRNRVTSPAPMPLEAPVTTATFGASAALIGPGTFRRSPLRVGGPRR